MSMVIFDEGGLAKCIKDIRQLSNHTYASMTDDAGYSFVPMDDLVAAVLHLSSIVGQVNGHLFGAIYQECIDELGEEIIDTYFVPEAITFELRRTLYTIIDQMASIFHQHYINDGCFRLAAVDNSEYLVAISEFSASDYTEINSNVTSVEINCLIWNELLDDEKLIIPENSSFGSNQLIYDYWSGAYVSADEWRAAYCGTGNSSNRNRVSYAAATQR